MTNTQRSQSRRVDSLAYANLGSGLLSLVLWAVPAVGTLGEFWSRVDRVGGNPFVVFLFALVFKVGTLVVVLLFWTSSALFFANGYLMLRRRRFGVCTTLSAILIGLSPIFGWIVGTMSLATLRRDWARLQFVESVQPPRTTQATPPESTSQS